MAKTHKQFQNKFIAAYQCWPDRIYHAVGNEILLWGNITLCCINAHTYTIELIFCMCILESSLTKGTHKATQKRLVPDDTIELLTWATSRHPLCPILIIFFITLCRLIAYFIIWLTTEDWFGVFHICLWFTGTRSVKPKRTMDRKSSLNAWMSMIIFLHCGSTVEMYRV